MLTHARIYHLFVGGSERIEMDDKLSKRFGSDLKASPVKAHEININRLSHTLSDCCDRFESIDWVKRWRVCEARGEYRYKWMRGDDMHVMKCLYGITMNGYWCCRNYCISTITIIPLLNVRISTAAYNMETFGVNAIAIAIAQARTPPYRWYDEETKCLSTHQYMLFSMVL